MKKGVQASFAIILLILGIAISLQYKSTQKNNIIQQEKSKDIQTVQAELIRQKNYSENLLNQIGQYEEKINNYEKNINVEDTLMKDLETSRVLAGIENVKGKGIVVDIDDTKTNNELLGIVTEEGYTVTDINLLELINELRAAGAQAISINDERIIATTEIRRAGMYIRINNKNYNSPFQIKAIGEPSILEGALKIREGIIEYLVINGVETKIEQKSEVSIPKFKGNINTDYLNKQ